MCKQPKAIERYYGLVEQFYKKGHLKKFWDTLQNVLVFSLLQNTFYMKNISNIGTVQHKPMQ